MALNGTDSVEKSFPSMAKYTEIRSIYTVVFPAIFCTISWSPFMLPAQEVVSQVSFVKINREWEPNSLALDKHRQVLGY